MTSHQEACENVVTYYRLMGHRLDTKNRCGQSI